MRLGVLGGTFDPIHMAHLVIASEALHRYELDMVIFIPSARPPHKKGEEYAPVEDRLKMVELAIEDNPGFGVSPLESERSGLSYTVDTLKELHGIYGEDSEYYFIIGADAVMEMQTWKSPEVVLAEAMFIISNRPGYPLDELEKALPESDVRGEPVKKRIEMLDAPEIGISATDIRSRVSEGRPFRYLVPETVWKYISDKGLYRKR